ncbi:unnamed protein product, partial [Tetraodon nigroviridis]
SCQGSESTASVRSLKETWLRWSRQHQEYQKQNPFSHHTRPSVASPLRGRGDYGRPPPGSKTELRGRDAHTLVSGEVRELCEAIRRIGDPGKVVTVEFGKLFDHYVTVSNKLVGILLRARKQGLVEFDGEMLWQGKDDRVVITLL